MTNKVDFFGAIFLPKKCRKGAVFTIHHRDIFLIYSNPKSLVNFLLPDREFGEGWGGVKNLRLLQ